MREAVWQMHTGVYPLSPYLQTSFEHLTLDEQPAKNCLGLFHLCRLVGDDTLQLFLWKFLSSAKLYHLQPELAVGRPSCFWMVHTLYKDCSEK